MKNMLTKFRNRWPDIGVYIVVPVFILFLPVLLLVTVFFGMFASKTTLKFKGDYADWLRNHEGEEFFAYTNRKNSVEVVEQLIIPSIDESVHIIKLIGKTPQSDLDERFISYALCGLKNVGFPSVMKVINGKMYDHSVHSPVYDIINQGRQVELPILVLQGFTELRKQYSVKN